MSMSQATAVVFAGYFEIEPEVNHSGGLLADRIRDLELKISSLDISIGNPSKLQKELISELKNELTSVLLEEIKSNIDKVQKALFDRLESELKSSLRKEPEKKTQPSSLGKPQPKNVDVRGNKQLGLAVDEKSSIEPNVKKPPRSRPRKSTAKKLKNTHVPNGRDVLTLAQLTDRLKDIEKSNTISVKKYNTKDRPEKFIEWSRDRDPDGYGWEFKEDSMMFYRVEPLA